MDYGEFLFSKTIFKPKQVLLEKSQNNGILKS